MGLTALFVPAEGPMEQFHTPDLDLDEVARRIGVDALDVVNVRPRAISVLVDDIALLRTPRPPVNLRATDLTGYPGGIYGDVVVVGLDPDTGETLDVPGWVIDLLTTPTVGGQG